MKKFLLGLPVMLILIFCLTQSSLAAGIFCECPQAGETPSSECINPCSGQVPGTKVCQCGLITYNQGIVSQADCDQRCEQEGLGQQPEQTPREYKVCDCTPAVVTTYGENHDCYKVCDGKSTKYACTCPGSTVPAHEIQATEGSAADEECKKSCAEKVQTPVTPTTTPTEPSQLVTQKPPKLYVPPPLAGFQLSDIQIPEEGGGSINVPWIAEYIIGIYRYSMGLAVILAVVIVMIAGVMYLTSAGNPQRVGMAKNYIIGALTGLVILASSYLILYLVSPELTELGPIEIESVKAEYIDDSLMDTVLEGDPDQGATLTEMTGPNIGKCVDTYKRQGGAGTKTLSSRGFEHIAIVYGLDTGNSTANNWDKVTIADLFSTHFNSSGGIEKGNYLTSSKAEQLVKDIRTKAPHVKIYVSLSMFSHPAINKTMLGQEPYKSNVLNYARDIVNKLNLDGISIDFEHPTLSDSPKITRDDVTQFFQDLKTAIGGKKINIYMPKSTSGRGYDVAALSNIVDHFSVMTYGVYRIKSKVTGPYTPPYGPDPFSKKWSLQSYAKYYNDLIPANNRHKLIIGLGIVGNEFHNPTAAQPGTTFSGGAHPTNLTIQGYAKNKKVCLHNSGVQWFQSGNKQYWFDDYESYKLKFQWIKSQIGSGNMGGWVDWTTKWTGPEYWAAIGDTF